MDEKGREHEEEEKHVPLFGGEPEWEETRLVNTGLETMVILQ